MSWRISLQHAMLFDSTWLSKVELPKLESVLSNLPRPSIQATETFSISAIRRFRFLIIGAFAEVALLIPSNNFSFAVTPWLIVWHKRPGFQPVSAFNVPSSLSLIISSFWFKVRDIGLLLSLEHLEATVGLLLIGLISILLCLREWGSPKRRREIGLDSGAVGTHTFINFIVLHGHGLAAPQNNSNSKIKAHWSQKTETNLIMKNSEYWHN